jgi:hypothetical protein
LAREKQNRGKSPLVSEEDRKLIRSRVAQERGRASAVTKKLLNPKQTTAVLRWQNPIPKPFTRSIVGEVQYGNLRPWMKAFAIWLLTRKVKPSADEMAEHATHLAHLKVSKSMVKHLRSRVDFHEYCEEVSADQVKLAKEMYAAALPNMIQGNLDALEIALKNRDVKGIVAVTQPALDRAYPKRDEQMGAVAQQIVVQVNTPGAVKSMVDLPEEQEIEVIVEPQQERDHGSE